MKTVLVISISSGENEVTDSLLSINCQQMVDFDLIKIKGLSNKAAHQELHDTVMDNLRRYHYFVKVDGDMVFSSTLTLCQMIKELEKDAQIDHAIFSVLDWYSQKVIIGMHVFSNRCTWGRLDDRLFTDSSPTIPGIRKFFWDSPSPVALHSPNPSIMQAFQFGFHRCLKIVQRDRRCPRLRQVRFQYNLIKNVYEQYLINPDVRRKAVLYGACEALWSKEKIFESRDHFQAYERKLHSLTLARCPIDDDIDRVWGMGKFNFNMLVNRTVFYPWVRKMGCLVYRKVKRILN